MQSQVSTAQDLKQILQKVIDKGKTLDAKESTILPPPVIEKSAQLEIQITAPLPEPVEAVSPITTEPLPPEPMLAAASPIMSEPLPAQPNSIPQATLDEKNRQISALKQVVKELAAKLAEHEKAQSVAETDLKKHRQLAIELTKRLKDQKSFELEQTELFQENERYKESLREVTSSLQEARSELQSKEDDLALKLQSSKLDNQDTKARLLRLIADKKELEDKVTSLACEKATLGARLQSLTQKSLASQQEQEQFLQTIKELTKTLEETTRELEQNQQALNVLTTESRDKQQKNEELRATVIELQENCHKQLLLLQEVQEKNSELASQISTKEKSHAQEISVCQACLVERTSSLEEEQRKHRLLAQEHLFIQKRVQEQENHLRLLEQHLARRVKECALSSKQLDEQMDRQQSLQNAITENNQKTHVLEQTLEQAKKIENALRIELDAQARTFEDKLEHADTRQTSLLDQLQTKEEELAVLRRVQTQFLQLEQLVKRSCEIFTTQDEVFEAEKPTAKPLSQKDIFAPAMSSKLAPQSLFE